MVHVNANLDLNTSKIIHTDRLNESFQDLCEEPLYITIVARNKAFDDVVWQEEGETFVRVVLPYKEVLSSSNVDILIAEKLYKLVDQINWINATTLKERLSQKILNIR